MKRVVSLLLAAVLILGCCASVASKADAANTSSSNIINVYDGGRNYSGRYAIYRDFGNYKGSLLGKKFTINCVNYLSQMSNSECSYFNKYARFQVYIYKNNGASLYKFYDNLKNGSSFKLPSGTYNIVIRSSIDSSGWGSFAQNTRLWPFAQYRLKY